MRLMMCNPEEIRPKSIKEKKNVARSLQELNENDLEAFLAKGVNGRKVDPADCPCSMIFNFSKLTEQLIGTEVAQTKRIRKISRSAQKSKKNQECKKSKSMSYYLKPGALAQIRDAQRNVRASLGTSIGKKRAAGIDPAALSDEGVEVREAQGATNDIRVPGCGPKNRGPACLQRKKLQAPKLSSAIILQASAAAEAPLQESTTMSEAPTSLPSSIAAERGSSGECLLEALPMELIVRIVCRLHHNELKPLFFVSRALRQAVLIARQSHFDFTTPGKDYRVPDSLPLARLSSTSEFGLGNPISRMPAPPNAPIHAPKHNKPRISAAEMRQIAATLFRPPRRPAAAAAAALPTHILARQTSFRSGGSHRVLFNEEELCQAIAQNSL